MTTHHVTSKGKSIPIAEMNDYHLHNALMKLRAMPEPDAYAREHLAALEAEQAKRGGPPKDAKDA